MRFERRLVLAEPSVAIDAIQRCLRRGLQLRRESLEVRCELLDHGQHRRPHVDVVLVATLLEPDSGTIEMNGADLLTRKDHTRRILGYLPQDFGLYPTLTAWQMLDYFAKLKGITDKKQRHSLIDALLERVNLSSARKQRVGGFSGGMRQRLGIA